MAEHPKASIGWGPVVDIRGLRDLYAPQEIKRFTPAPAGIDNLALSSTDTFIIPGRGAFEVDFEGYFRVARDNPTTDDWATCETYVNMIDIRLRGNSPAVGPIAVSINPEFVSAGQVLPAGAANQGASCRIAASVVFDLPQVQMSPQRHLTLFNKEPVLLMNDAIESIPPVEDPNGEAHIYYLPFFDVTAPNGKPIAYLTSLRYTVGNYITEEEARAFREQ